MRARSEIRCAVIPDDPPSEPSDLQRRQTHSDFPLPTPIPNRDVLFLHELQSRKIRFTYVFIVFNFVVFLLMEFLGGTTDPSTLFAFGAKSNPAIDSGEVWRFLTPVFIHIGLLHLAFNSYALWIVGQQVERLYGSARFVVLYVLMGIAGVVGSYVFNPGSLSAGASGAIFGLFGVLLIFGIRNRQTVPAFLRRAIGAGVLPVILLNLVIGFTIPAIDNAAHLGGLLAGMMLAAAVRFQEPGMSPGRLARIGQVAALAIVLTSFQQVAVNFDQPGSTDRFIDSVNAVERSWGSSRRAIRNGYSDLRVHSDSLVNSIDLIEAAPSLSTESDEILTELGDVLRNQYLLVEQIHEVGEVRDIHIRELERNTGRFRNSFDELFDWVEREGAVYGIRLQDRTDDP